MNRIPDVELVLRDYFADDGLTAPDHVLDVVEGRIGRLRQRRSWRLPWRLQTMNSSIRLAAGLTAAIVVAVVAWQLLPGRQNGIGGPGSPTPTLAPSVQPAPTVIPLPDDTLEAGRYRFDLSFVEPGLVVDADFPAGWHGHPGVVAATSPDGENEGILLTFMEVDGLFSDPCQWDLDGSGSVGSEQRGDVEVGPTVDDLVAALEANTSYTSSTPVPVTIGGYPGKELELQLPSADVIQGCDRREGQTIGDYFVFPGGFYAQSSNSRWQLSILDVEGSRLIVLVSIAEGTPASDIAAAAAIVDSFEITP